MGTRDEAAWQELSKLDGCYCLKTDLKDAEATKELVHDRYKSLAEVEWAFRTSKSTLHVRPVYVRKESRTRGHVFVVMLAYQIVKELAACWCELDMTPDIPRYSGDIIPVLAEWERFANHPQPKADTARL